MYLYHGQRIYHNPDTGRDTVHPVSFLWDDVLELRGSKGQELPFKTAGGKTYVLFAGDRGMWVQEQLSEMRALWERYIAGDTGSDDKDEPEQPEPAPAPRMKFIDLSNLSPN